MYCQHFSTDIVNLMKITANVQSILRVAFEILWRLFANRLAFGRERFQKYTSSWNIYIYIYFPARFQWRPTALGLFVKKRMKKNPESFHLKLKEKNWSYQNISRFFSTGCSVLAVAECDWLDLSLLTELASSDGQSPSTHQAGLSLRHSMVRPCPWQHVCYRSWCFDYKVEIRDQWISQVYPPIWPSEHSVWVYVYSPIVSFVIEHVFKWFIWVMWRASECFSPTTYM